ncbi:hypothetical protein B0H14DRAFT_3151324 [Mycena olivaceomarginata]|nr:hypothetical protein B0H14DRAFT_3151324 [Mycena olivaceomarginata]
MHPTSSPHIQITRTEITDIAKVTGPAPLGYLFNWCLFGTLTVQLYFYYQAFPKDRVLTKCLVYTVYVIESVQTVLVTQDAFSNFAYGFGEVTALLKLNFQWFPLPIMSGLVALIGQSFYAYRVYVLSNSWKTPLFIETFSLASSVGAFMTAYFTHQTSISPFGNLEQLRRSSAVWLGGSALSDVIIAACLTYYLLKSDTGFRRTHILIVRLVWIIIETGCLTAVVAVITLIFFLRSSPYFFTPAFVLPMLYANTILAVLNSRFQILDGRGYISTTNMMTAPSFLAHDRAIVGPARSVQSPIISIERETFAARELDDLGKTGYISSTQGDGTHV